jgi:hypothetical protein
MKQEYVPYCVCEACCAQIYKGAEDPIGCHTLSRQLRLPEGWIAWEYVDHIALEHEDGRKAAFSKPADPKSQAWWERQAAKAIKQNERKNLETKT